MLAAPPSPKAALRQAALERRRAVDAGTRCAFAAALVRTGVAHALQLRAQNPALRTISFYMPIGDEPDVRPLLTALAAAGFATLLPVTGKRGMPLVFRRWKPGDPLVKGQMDIDEPAASAQAADPDLMFVPLAAFDRLGHRIGYGAGHYDCSIAELKAKRTLITIGVAFSISEIPSVPHESHDQCLDAIITEREWIECQER